MLCVCLRMAELTWNANFYCRHLPDGVLTMPAADLLLKVMWFFKQNLYDYLDTLTSYLIFPGVKWQQI